MTTLIRNVLPHKRKERCDVLIENESIVSVQHAGTVDTTAHSVIDGTGYILFPGFIDAHTHFDKTLWGLDWFCNDLSDDIQSRIHNECTMRVQMKLNAYEQATKAIRLAIGYGTLYMRSHVDVDEAIGLSSIEDMLRIRADWKELFDLQLVAFPQSGIVRSPRVYEMIDKALSEGIDLIGGIDPANVERDPKGAVEALFRLADKHGKQMDIHLHEPGHLGAFDLELILEKVEALGMNNMVTISHALCLGYDEAYYEPLTDRMARSGVSITTGGQAYMPVVPMIKPLMEKGILVAGGNDSMRDMWSPYGTGDILERVQFIAMRNLYRRDDDIARTMDLVTYNAARLLGLHRYGTEVGDKANLVLVRGRNVPDCVVTCPKDRVVIRDGAVIAQGGYLM